MGRAPTPARRGLLAALCLLVVALPLVALPARAGDEPEEAVAAEKSAEPAGLDNESLEKRLSDNPQAALALLLARVVPIGVGLLLLILWYLKRDKIKGGLLPPPARARTTRPFGVLVSLLLVVGAMVVFPALVLEGLRAEHGWQEAKSIPLWAQVLAVGAGSVPVALWVVGRRLRLARAPDAALASVTAAAAGTVPPRLLRAFGLGWWTLCVAAIVVVPIALVWALVLEAVGVPPVVQELVQQVVDPRNAYDPLLIATFGVLVAPFAEETIFRGMLYPAAKQAFGGGRRGMWIGAIVVSLLFAGIHGSWLALLPLFALAMVLTWVFETTNSLGAVVTAHALHNFFSLVPLLLLGNSS